MTQIHQMLAVSWSSSEYFTCGAIYIYVQGVSLNIETIVFITQVKCLGELLGTTNTQTNCISFHWSV